MIEIVEVESGARIEIVRQLLREYEAWFGMSLCFQNFEAEVAALPGFYARPDGRLLLALADGEPAGCVGLRRLERGVCEMKRLYVRERFRGRRLGVALLERLLAEARAAGYETMRLDTYPPKMGTAVGLYEAYGFRAIAPYYHNPHDDTLFMEKDLAG